MKRILCLISAVVFLFSCSGEKPVFVNMDELELFADVSPDEAYEAASSTEDPAEKIKTFLRVCKSFPDTPYVFYSRIAVFDTYLESFDDAEHAGIFADELLASAPAEQKTAIRSYIAYGLADKGLLFEKAREFAQVSIGELDNIKDERTKADIYDAAGWVAYKENKYNEALTNIGKACEIDAYNAERLARLGRIFEKSGDGTRAVEAYISSVSVFGNDNEETMALLKNLYLKEGMGSAEDLDNRISAERAKATEYAVFTTRAFDKPLPEMDLIYLNGNPLKTSDLIGKVAVINAWGIWCRYCVMELPHFQKVEKDSEGKGIAFIAVNFEREGDEPAKRKKVESFMKDNGYTFPVALDLDGQAVRALEVTGFPTSYVVDRDGMIKFKNVGFDPDYEKILKMQIERLL